MASGVDPELRRLRRVSARSPAAARAIPGGPVASQEAIKELGTNGGGFFNANSAHPFENPNPFTNLFEIFLLLVIPVSPDPHPGHDGRATASRACAVLGAMAVLWAVAPASDHLGRGRRALAGARQAAGAAMEGKETQFGIWASRAVRGQHHRHLHRRGQLVHDSLTPAGGGVVLVNMMLGEVVAGRGRLRPLRDPDLADPRRLHRRPDGRPDAGVPRQEDRRAGDDATSRSTC